VELIQKLNKLGEQTESSLQPGGKPSGPMKSRGIYGNPGGANLYQAHEVLETLCLDRDTQHYKQ
jgi:argininosuccinate synthase